MLEKRALFSKEKIDSYDKLKHRTRELRILKEVEDKIHKLKQQEIKNTKKAYDRRINEEKEKANLKSRKLIKTIIDQDKLRKYNICYDVRLQNFRNEKFILKICMKYYGEDSYKECSTKENFCERCCYHNIGINHIQERITCKEECSKIISGGDEIKSRRKKKA